MFNMDDGLCHTHCFNSVSANKQLSPVSCVPDAAKRSLPKYCTLFRFHRRNILTKEGTADSDQCCMD